MEKIFLSDEIIDEKHDNAKKSKKRYDKIRNKDNKDYKHFRSESQHALIRIMSKKKDIPKLRHKKLSDKIIISKFNREKRNSIKTKEKRRDSLFSLIASNFSNIQGNVEVNLFMNNNDSFINTIVNQMNKN